MSPEVFVPCYGRHDLVPARSGKVLRCTRCGAERPAPTPDPKAA